ncbi:MAG: hypothetical protein AAF549_05870, partial [Pseudomonadota bacterium]
FPQTLKEIPTKETFFQEENLINNIKEYKRNAKIILKSRDTDKLNRYTQRYFPMGIDKESTLKGFKSNGFRVGKVKEDNLEYLPKQYEENYFAYIGIRPKFHVFSFNVSVRLGFENNKLVGISSSSSMSHL